MATLHMLLGNFPCNRNCIIVFDTVDDTVVVVVIVVVVVVV